jgi:hypothetical protein
MFFAQPHCSRAGCRRPCLGWPTSPLQALPGMTHSSTQVSSDQHPRDLCLSKPLPFPFWVVWPISGQTTSPLLGIGGQALSQRKAALCTFRAVALRVLCSRHNKAQRRPSKMSKLKLIAVVGVVAALSACVQQNGRRASTRTAPLMGAVGGAALGAVDRQQHRDKAPLSAVSAVPWPVTQACATDLNDRPARPGRTI